MIRIALRLITVVSLAGLSAPALCEEPIVSGHLRAATAQLHFVIHIPQQLRVVGAAAQDGFSSIELNEGLLSRVSLDGAQSELTWPNRAQTLNSTILRDPAGARAFVVASP